ncbi:RNA polymerase factor sigma-54 [Bacteroidales bacterium]|nr:RNA polymerase factor sigma-54 [Bacteroidales bacterium]
MLKQGLQQKLLQKLSPQQIQMIKLLELPTMQLEQRIKKEIEENPVLEMGKDDDDEETEIETGNAEEQDEYSIDEMMQEDGIPSYKLQANNFSKDDKKEEIPFSIGVSFRENLEAQLGLRRLSEKEEMLAQYLLGNIDEDGYLRRDLENIVDDLAFSQNVMTDEQELFKILKIIQDFEPVGVGAQDLQECLMLQVSKKDQELEEVRIAGEILDRQFDEFTKKHYEKIKSRLGLDDDLLKEAIQIILSLNPKPGGSYSDPANKTVQQITPDFVLENNDNVLELSLNGRNVPDLRLSRQYKDMVAEIEKEKKKSKNDKEAMSFVKQKLDSARWFIDAVEQRQHTLLSTMEAIVAYQKDYFDEGDEAKLKPMILKDIADATGLDISTISRVANSKYIQTHFGIFPLKYFFSEGMQNTDGEEVSTREIKSILQSCVDNEDKKKPLTDDKLAEIILEKGYKLARRTVAKYREQLNIPVARLRKEL